MAAVFKELPIRLTGDTALDSLRMCDADPEEMRERALEIFGEALEASQEQQISELQDKLATKESETARLGRQLGSLVTEQREATEALQTDLSRAQARIEELEQYYRASTSRHAALEKTATTLEEETLHWRQRCKPLRDRCAELEDEIGALRVERKADRDIVEAARKARDLADAEVVAARARAKDADETCKEAAKKYDSESGWLRKELMAMLGRLFQVMPAEDETQHEVTAAWGSEELTQASDRFIEALTQHVKSLEAAAAESEARAAAAVETMRAGEEELQRARTAASMSSEHAHHMVERTLAAEREQLKRDIANITQQEHDARVAAEEEAAALREQLQNAAEERASLLAKAKAEHEASLHERSQQYTKDMRALTESFKEARTELVAQAEQLREARRQKLDAERALHSGLDAAMQRVDAAEAKLREQSYLSAQLAGHASSALQQEMLSIFSARDLLSTSTMRTRSAASAGAPTPATAMLSPTGAAGLASSRTPEQRHEIIHAEATSHPGWSPPAKYAQHNESGDASSMAAAGTIHGGVPVTRRAPVPMVYSSAMAMLGVQAEHLASPLASAANRGSADNTPLSAASSMPPDEGQVTL